MPKKLGGLNIGNLHHKNTALLFKWVWRLLNEPNALWCQVIKSKYSISPYFTIQDLKPLVHGGPWKFICNSISKNEAANFLANHRVRKKVGLPSYCQRIFLSVAPPLQRLFFQESLVCHIFHHPLDHLAGKKRKTV